MKKLGDLFSSLLATIWRYTPWKLNHISGKILAFIWYDVFKIRKNVLLSNIAIAFPDMSLAEREVIAKKSMVALCRSFFDVFKIPSLNSDWISKNVVFDGVENIESVKSYDGGVFFLSMHIGSGDLLGAIVSREIRPLSLISKRFKNRFLDSFWFGMRQRSKTKFINPHDKNNAYEILAALKDKRGVVFVLDQFMGRPYGVETQFFGVTTGTAYGLALFAKKTQRPIYPLYTYWDDLGKFHVCLDEAIDLTHELSQTNEVITNRLNREIERIVRKHPEHWMWVHKRWKTFE